MRCGAREVRGVGEGMKSNMHYSKKHVDCSCTRGVLCSPFRTEIFRKTLRVQEGGRTFLDSKNAMVAPRTNVTIDKHSPVKKASKSFSIREEQR